MMIELGIKGGDVIVANGHKGKGKQLLHAQHHLTRTGTERERVGNNRQIHQFNEYKHVHVDTTYHTSTQSSYDFFFFLFLHYIHRYMYSYYLILLLFNYN